jgi:hypothetical protein
MIPVLVVGVHTECSYCKSVHGVQSEHTVFTWDPGSRPQTSNE